MECMPYVAVGPLDHVYESDDKQERTAPTVYLYRLRVRR